MKNPRILLVVTGWNCSSYVFNCLNSIQSQTYKNFDYIVIDDGSKDCTYENISFWYYSKKIKLIHGVPSMAYYKLDINQGTVYSKNVAIKKAGSNYNVIVFLDLDDALHPQALERVAKEYEEKNCWLTYGNYVDNHGVVLSDIYDLTIDKEIIDQNKFRQSKWAFTPLRTVRRELYCKLTDDDLFKNTPAYPDLNMLYSLMEMCPSEKISLIPEPLYIYNVTNPNSVLNRFDQLQRDAELKYIQSLPPKEKLLSL